MVWGWSVVYRVWGPAPAAKRNFVIFAVILELRSTIENDFSRRTFHIYIATYCHCQFHCTLVKRSKQQNINWRSIRQEMAGSLRAGCLLRLYDIINLHMHAPDYQDRVQRKRLDRISRWTNQTMRSQLKKVPSYLGLSFTTYIKRSNSVNPRCCLSKRWISRSSSALDYLLNGNQKISEKLQQS